MHTQLCYHPRGTDIKAFGKMEKSKANANVTVSIIDSEQEHHNVEPVSKWLPGYWKRFPFIGAFALAFIAALACIALGVLVGSDGVSTSTWPQ